MEKKLRFYVAGKITGCDDFVENFAKGCEEVKALGYEPINPCDHMPDGWTYFQYLIYDLHLLLDADGIYVLRNWATSRGARIEVRLAYDLEKQVIFQESDTMLEDYTFMEDYYRNGYISEKQIEEWKRLHPLLKK